MTADQVRERFQLGETAVTILAEERFLPLAKESIFRCREDILRFISQDPFFRDTLEPYEAPANAPEIVRRMSVASALAGVGPMAAVAGAIAQEAVRSMVEAGARHAIVDNGGDIAMFLSEEAVVGIYAGESRWNGLGMRFPGDERHVSVCTSSGTVGPSISFGMADAAVVVAEDAALADACATRLGNEAKSAEEKSMRRAVELVARIPGVRGALLIIGERMACKGDLPPLVLTKVDLKEVSRPII
ncbi:MAG: UPF0280 family protein [Methanomassiliicoccales archaeon]